MKVAVLGYGTVGRGVSDMVEKASDLELKAVLLHSRKPGDIMQAVYSADDIVNDKDIEAVAECIGGVETAFDFACRCISAGKHFVTANKALIAAKGIELKNLAEKNNVKLLFSAACGGAIPVLHNVSVAKKTDEIISCGGILNGTTNFILSSLESGLFSSYNDALKEAQNLGYAEADPTADVSGLDSLRKTVLLSAVAFDRLPSGKLLNEGIENIDLCPSELRSISYCVKLIGSTSLNENGYVSAFVEPVVFRRNSVWGSVSSNFNLAYYTGKNCGQISIAGQGAGRYPTASAVLRDLSALADDSAESMLSCDCKETEVNNSFVCRRYVLSDGKNVKITEPVSVEKMHSDVALMRSNGQRCFFAALDKEVEDEISV